MCFVQMQHDKQIAALAAALSSTWSWMDPQDRSQITEIHVAEAIALVRALEAQGCMIAEKVTFKDADA